jgi:hypothetical protein
LCATNAFSQPSPILKFSIADQFDSLHTEQDYLGSITIIVGSDKGGSQYNKIWAKAIRDSLAQKAGVTQINVLPVADVSSVPFFSKGFVKSKFPQTRNEWVLLDWKGYFAEAYKFSNDACNIVVIDKNGGMFYETSVRQLEGEKLKTICSKIMELAQATRK